MKQFNMAVNKENDKAGNERFLESQIWSWYGILVTNLLYYCIQKVLVLDLKTV